MVLSPAVLHPSTAIQDQPFVVLDLETTGGSATYDRIIEVAAVRVRAGAVEGRIDLLVDPCTSVPPFISRLTGINQAMVRGRPRIESVLPALDRLTRGAVLVAHNASFDRAFLANAFARAGVSWQPPVLCTLKLARRLVPGLPSYKLDSLCAHLDFGYVQRHRAAPDAEATISLLQYLLGLARQQGVEDVSMLLQLQAQPVGTRRRKANVDEAQVASLPAGPGVYLLKDARGHIVYIGKSVNVRQRVRTHLRPSGTAGGAGQPRLRRRLPYIADVEAIATGSDLEALTLESKLVKRYVPEANRLLRDSRDYPFVKVDTSDAFPRVVATRERPTADAVYFGPFRKSALVASAVAFLNEQLGLRQCKDPIRRGMPSCPLLELRKCLGPCVGAIPPERYQAAVDEAQRLLRGQDTGVLERAAERRDELAEALRFEEAAELRDRIHALEHLVGAQRRLDAFGERHLAIVTPDARVGSAHLFLVWAGRLAYETSIPATVRPGTVGDLLHAVYRQPAPLTVSRDEVDEMVILDAWLRHRREAAVEVPVAPGEPGLAMAQLLTALRAIATRPNAARAAQRARAAAVG